MFTIRENKTQLKGKTRKKNPGRSNQIDSKCLGVVVTFKLQLHAIENNGYQH